MTKDEMENKSRAFITEISEILGLGKPIDILKLCATTDLFFKPLEERITELEKENAQLKKQQFSLRNERNTFLAQNEQYEKDLINFNENLTKAKEILRKFLDAKSIEETCVAESEADKFLSEVENA